MMSEFLLYYKGTLFLEYMIIDTYKDLRKDLKNMNKPYIICYMMTSVDGRIDCAMTEHLPGVTEYYKVLDELNLDATISGRVTAQLEIAEPGKFVPKTHQKVGEEKVSKKTNSKQKYDVIVDTKGCLLWKNDEEYENHLIIVTSTTAPKEYLEYLDELHISYIVTGQNKINLQRAVEILKDEFNIERLGIVGGGKINTGFLDCRLLDEVVLLIGAGIDGNASFGSVFERDDIKPVTPLKLLDVKRFDSDAVLIRYKIKKD